MCGLYGVSFIDFIAQFVLRFIEAFYLNLECGFTLLLI